MYIKIVNIDADDEVELWLSAINAKTEEQLSTIKTKGGEVMEQLVEAYHSVVGLPEFHEIERQRERARHNEASVLYNAKREGREEGREEERQDNIKLMYQLGLSIEAIAGAFNFPVKDVKKILGL